MKDKIIEILSKHFPQNNSDFASVADDIIDARKIQNRYDDVRRDIVNMVKYGFESKEHLRIALELKLIDQDFYDKEYLRTRDVAPKNIQEYWGNG